MTQLSTDDRRAVLQREVNKYVKKGFVVVSQTDTSAQLIKYKTFSLFWAFLWFLLFGIGLLIYLIYYWSKKSWTVYITVDEQGRIKRQ